MQSSEVSLSRIIISFSTENLLKVHVWTLVNYTTFRMSSFFFLTNKIAKNVRYESIKPHSLHTGFFFTKKKVINTIKTKKTHSFN